MKKIIYFEPNDATDFDLNRYVKSLNKYAEISKEEIETALETVDKYENMHVSLLVEIGVKLIEEKKDAETAEKYFADHSQYFGEKFERLRRITGYLVGTLDRWNDGKKAEEKARVKHSVDGVYSCEEKAARESAKSEQKSAVGKE